MKLLNEYLQMMKESVSHSQSKNVDFYLRGKSNENASSSILVKINLLNYESVNESVSESVSESVNESASESVDRNSFKL